MCVCVYSNAENLIIHVADLNLSKLWICVFIKAEVLDLWDIATVLRRSVCKQIYLNIYTIVYITLSDVVPYCIVNLMVCETVWTSVYLFDDIFYVTRQFWFFYNSNPSLNILLHFYWTKYILRSTKDVTRNVNEMHLSWFLRCHVIFMHTI